MTTRDEFLGRVRANLHRGVPANVAHPSPGPLHAVPGVRYQRPLDDAIGAFVEAAAATGAIICHGPADEIVREAVSASGARTAVVTDDPETAGVPALLAGLGVEVLPFSSEGPQAAAAADIGITGAAWGIAATGSLVLDAARAGGRTASLLVPVHVALVRSDRVLPDAGAFFRQMSERFPAGLPSQVVFATGPSRSADIELVITVGVHGPKEVWIGLLPAGQQMEAAG